MSKYSTWKTRDGRSVSVSLMTDLHLLHTIRAILDGRVFPPANHPYHNGDEREGLETGEVLTELSRDAERENWLTVLKGEALKRGLDWSKPPTRRVGLVDHVVGLCEKYATLNEADYWRDRARYILNSLGFEQPEVDVDNKTGKVTYLHWQCGPGVGTPLAG